MTLQEEAQQIQECLDIEIWRDIPEYEGLYQASNLGRIRSLDRFVNASYGKRLVRSQIIRQSVNNDYFYVVISKFDISVHLKVHQLIARAFIPNVENKPYVNHIDGNRQNNRVENLEWVTKSENAIHAYRVLGRKSSASGPNSINKLKSKPVSQYSKEGIFIKEWGSICDVSRDLGIPTGNISKCCMGNRNYAGGFKWKYKNK